MCAAAGRPQRRARRCVSTAVWCAPSCEARTLIIGIFSGYNTLEHKDETETAVLLMWQIFWHSSFCFNIHRRAAKYAENIHFMFAVERTANIKGNPPKRGKSYRRDALKIERQTIARRAYVFNFLTSQQKVKRKQSLCVLGVSSEAGGEYISKH